MRLDRTANYKEIDDLMVEVNNFLDKHDNISKTAKQREETLKEAITDLSHDIRTPLTSLDGYFQLLVDSKSEEESKSYQEIINNKIKSLKDMLEEMFTYMKLQNDIYDIETSTIDFGKVIYDTTLSFYDDFTKANLEPEIDFTEEVIKIKGSERDIRRVIQNILKNTLVHSKSNVYLSLEKQGDTAVFICSNDIKEADDIDVDRLFTRFYKADAARTSISSGLGLPIAKRLVEKMEGKIEARIENRRFIIEIRMPIETNIV